MFQKLTQKFSGGKTIALMTSAGIVNSIVSIFSGFLVAKWMMPEDLGLFNSLSIFTSYIILLQIGIPSGLSRDLPYYYGKNQPEHAMNLASTSKFIMIALSIFVLLVSVLVSIYFLVINSYEYAVGSIVIGLTSAQNLYVTKYLKVLYRTNNHFNKLANINYIVTFFNLITIILVYKFLFFGLCLRAIILAFVDWYFTEKWKPLHVKAFWNYKIFLSISKVGMPIYFVASIYGLWPTFQRTLILAMLGVKGLGLYALATIVQNVLSTLNNTISSISFPKMSMAFGEGKSVLEIFRIPLKLVIVSIIIYTIILLIGWPTIAWVVNRFLPNYIEGIEAAKWMFIVALVSAFSIFSNIYMVVRKNHHRLVSYIIGIGVWALYIFSSQVSGVSDLVIFSKALLWGLISTFVCDVFFYIMYFREDKRLRLV